MLVLGIDTATRIGSVGLVCDGEPVAEETCEATSNHATTLFPLITRLLGRAEKTLAEVDGIGVSIGPGSFTGLRIAVSAAKGFAYALGHRVVGVSTLEALARTVTDYSGIICPILDARKREIYAALFRRDPSGTLQRLTPDMVLTLQSLLVQIPEPCLFLGDGVETYGQQMRELLGARVQILPFPDHPPRGTVVARMAWERLCRGEHDDVSTLVPSYVRAPEAEVQRQRWGSASK